MTTTGPCRPISLASEMAFLENAVFAAMLERRGSSERYKAYTITSAVSRASSTALAYDSIPPPRPREGKRAITTGVRRVRVVVRGILVTSKRFSSNHQSKSDDSGRSQHGGASAT